MRFIRNPRPGLDEVDLKGYNYRMHVLVLCARLQWSRREFRQMTYLLVVKEILLVFLLSSSFTPLCTESILLGTDK